LTDPQQWFIRKDAVIHGPATTQDLKSLLDANRITLQFEASQTKDGPWRPLADYPEFAPVRPIADLFDAPTAAPAPQSPIGISYVTETPAQLQQPVSIPVALSAPSAPSATSPTAEALIASVLGEPGVPAGRTLTDKARTEFISGLEVEVNRQIEDKCFPISIAAWIITLILIAKFSMVTAFIFAFIVGGIVFKITKAILQDKYQKPIYNLSDEMLVARYNESKADRRAARTRTAISWAVIVIIAVVAAIVWFAAQRQ
jgi:hypothetical protein